MATGAGTRVEERLAKLVEQNPELTTPGLLRNAYKAAYNATLEHNKARRFLDLRPLRTDTTLADDDFVSEDAEPETAPPSSSSFVPDELLENIGPIDQSCTLAGSYDNAMKIAETIERCGGVENFRKGIELLKRIPTKTTQ